MSTDFYFEVGWQADEFAKMIGSHVEYGPVNQVEPGYNYYVQGDGDDGLVLVPDLNKVDDVSALFV